MSSSKAKSAASKNKDEELIDLESAKNILFSVKSILSDNSYAGVINLLLKLKKSAPQVLLFEGGDLDSRLLVARLWSVLLNCPNQLDSDLPCFNCPTCYQMVTGLHRDCFFFDGFKSSIKIDEVREMRSSLGEPPSSSLYRLVIFNEAQALVHSAANGLLKSLEEKRPRTSFVLLVAQRERLFSTLVSRSMVITLPRKLVAADDPLSAYGDILEWEHNLVSFLDTGRDLFSKTGLKGSVNINIVQGICIKCSIAILKALGGRDDGGILSSFFCRLPLARLKIASEVLAECHLSLQAGANPTLVLEWLVTRLFLLLPRS